MQKFRTKAILKAMEFRQRACARLGETDGNVLTENGVYIVIGIVLALIVLAWATGFLQNTFLPKLGNTITGIFDKAS